MCMEIQRLEAILGSFTDIWIVGGGSKSFIWCQMFADVLNRPVHVCNTSEVGCRGAAICAGVALGFLEEAKDLKAPEEKCEYVPCSGKHSFYMEQGELYRELNNLCAEIWKKQNQLNKTNK
jgi:L-xylulokinase